MLRETIAGMPLQCYTFVVGKLTVEKLANFAEVDLFVNIACRESSFVDSTVRNGTLCFMTSFAAVALQ